MGIVYILKDLKRKIGVNKVNLANKSIETVQKERQIKILLLTNRDSDNLGDQVIEACDISLIKAAMENLGIKSDSYKIISRAASIISQKYLSTKEPKLLESATKLIENVDIILFGGAPLFNYLYQNFYERTIVTLKIAEKFHKPVIFSAIGIERYEETNKKCQNLKEMLNLECVKQITTRDDFDSLQKYINNEKIVINMVSDPAVFASKVFEKYILVEKPAFSRKKIGIFILRENGFVDNKVNFSKEDVALFWINLIQLLDSQNYDYELLTSGHFSDEVFLDSLIRDYGIDSKKCVFNMNTPEKLIRKISSYNAIISCRLHPSIIAFSLNIPSLGIIWNPKVEHFYSSIGYKDRTINVKDIDYKEVAKKLEDALANGVKKDEEYLISVYNYLFNILKKIINVEDNLVQPYSYKQLLEKIPFYEGTSQREQEKKLERKFRRIYKSYNDLNNKYKQEKL